MAIGIVYTPIGYTIKSWITGKAGPVMPETQDYILTKTYKSGAESAKMIHWDRP